MQHTFYLNVVVGEYTAILKLLSSEDQTLLVARDTLLVLDLPLDVVRGVRRPHHRSNHLAGRRLDEYLHAATETKD